jgi:hypothetical protein
MIFFLKLKKDSQSFYEVIMLASISVFWPNKFNQLT